MSLNLSIRLVQLLVHFCIFCRFVWLFRLKSIILRHDILLKSVVFVCQKLLKSVNGYAVQEDYIIHRGLSEVR